MRVRTNPRSRWLVAGLAGAALIGLLLAISNSGSRPDSDRQLEVAGAGGSARGERAPSFSIQTLDGDTFAFPTGKPTAIFFTASYCGSCLPKAEALGRIKADVGDRIAVVGIDIDPSDTPASFREWIDAAGNPPFAYAMDIEGRLVRAFDVRALSTVVIADGDGNVVFRSSAEDGEETLRDAFRRAGLT